MGYLDYDGLGYYHGKVDELKANKDGSYTDMTVGNAEQLVATVGVEDKVPYNFRTSGGSADIGNREVDKIVGGTVAWNQLIPLSALPSTKTESDLTITNNGNGTLTINGTASANVTIICDSGKMPIDGHRYYLRGCPSGGSSSTYYIYDGYSHFDYGDGYFGVLGLLRVYIFIKSGAVINNLVFKPQITDITQMFGSTIEGYIKTLETATAGSGIAKLKSWGFFTKDYYAYDAGSLQSVQAAAHEMVGFNALDIPSNIRTDFFSLTDTTIKNIQSDTRATFQLAVQFTKNGVSVAFAYNGGFNSTGKKIVTFVMPNVDADTIKIKHNGSSKDLPIVEQAYSSFIRGETYCLSFDLESNNPTAVGGLVISDLCINLSSSRNGEYEPYVKHTYPLDDSLTLRGIPKLDADNKLYMGKEQGRDRVIY